MTKRESLSDLKVSELIELLNQAVTTSEGLKTLNAKVDHLTELVEGNGTPERGIVVRLDRLERLVMYLGIIVMPIVSAFISWAVSHLFK